MEDKTPLDQELADTMDTIFNYIKTLPDNQDTDDQLRLRVVAHNLRALAQVFMMCEEDKDFEVIPTQVALGLLGTAAWALDSLPILVGDELTLPDF